MTQEVLKLALEFIENSECGTADLEARIKEALAQTQEPVAWPCLIAEADFSKGTVTIVMQCDNYKVSAGTHWLSTTPPQHTEQEPVQFKCTVIDDVHPNGIPLEQWTPPPQRTWVDLTAEQMLECNMDGDWTTDRETAKLNVQAKLKEKNT